ncbi:hypothetical protein Bca52824_025304 [Brassica carinata]|uniref:Uncharacterized protein n=1 Tax=Brassica carinata TaxID=52824 RepID=A0A8X8AWN5_BRACI|nr:hypothetical protein Bca52824_025304 [Brassica carinata]
MDEAINADDQMVHEEVVVTIPEADRLPATLRLGSTRSGSKKKGDIPVAEQSKMASKRKTLYYNKEKASN